MGSDEFKAPEYWKRVNTVMMIRARFKDKEIMEAACMVSNTIKTIRAELKETNNDYKDVVDRKKGKSSVRTPDFIKKLKKKVEEDPSKSTTTLGEEMGGMATTIRLCISDDIR